MKKLLAILLFNLYFGAIAQDRAKLNGSWQAYGDVVYRNSDDSILSKNIKNPYFIITINNTTGNLFNTPIGFKVDSTAYKECIVKIKENKKKLILKDIKFADSIAILNNNDDFCYYGEKQSIIYDYKIISDSEIVLTELLFYTDPESSLEDIYSAEYKLKKIATLKYSLISDLTKRCLRKEAAMLNNKLYLTKYGSLHKVVALKVGGYFWISTEKKSKVSDYSDDANYYVDAIDSLMSDSIIKVHTTNEIISTHDSDGFLSKKTKYNRSYIYNAPLTEIKLSEISYISYNGSQSLKLHNVSKNIGWISLISALIVAPLVSINYKHSDFDKQRYFNVAGISLGTMTLSFTIAGITNYTQYLIGKKYKKNHGWRIINKLNF